MTEAASLAAAHATVAARRRLLVEDAAAHRGGLAEALRALSLALQQAGRDDDALAAARESVAVLSPDFLAGPEQCAGAMRAQLTHYVALAQRLRQPPDEVLLAPIAQALGDLARTEDAGEDDPQ